ncbi:MAG: metalloregulator ArsR/SmtB family transcription factor [Acidobacteriota bacterium]
MIEKMKAVAHESRLRLLGLLASQEHSVEQLSELLALRGPTVSHHLSVLRRAGLVSVRQEGTTRWHRLDGDGLQTLSTSLAGPSKVAQLSGEPPADAWDRKVLENFVKGETLQEIPASLKKRQVILRWLVEKFEHGERYRERDLNALIARHHEDVATLRRELIVSKLMAREDGIYWRLPQDQPDEAS